MGLVLKLIRRSHSLSYPQSGLETCDSKQSLLMCDEFTNRHAERDSEYTGACCSCKAVSRCQRAGFYFSPKYCICLAPSLRSAVCMGCAKLCFCLLQGRGLQGSSKLCAVNPHSLEAQGNCPDSQTVLIFHR